MIKTIFLLVFVIIVTNSISAFSRPRQFRPGRPQRFGPKSPPQFLTFLGPQLASPSSLHHSSHHGSHHLPHHLQMQASYPFPFQVRPQHPQFNPDSIGSFQPMSIAHHYQMKGSSGPLFQTQASQPMLLHSKPSGGFYPVNLKESCPHGIPPCDLEPSYNGPYLPYPLDQLNTEQHSQLLQDDYLAQGPSPPPRPSSSSSSKQKAKVVYKPVVKVVKVPVEIPVKVKTPYPVKIPFPVEVPVPFKVIQREKIMVPIAVPISQVVPLTLLRNQPELQQLQGATLIDANGQYLGPGDYPHLIPIGHIDAATAAAAVSGLGVDPYGGLASPSIKSSVINHPTASASSVSHKKQTPQIIQLTTPITSTELSYGYGSGSKITASFDGYGTSSNYDRYSNSRRNSDVEASAKTSLSPSQIAQPRTSSPEDHPYASLSDNGSFEYETSASESIDRSGPVSTETSYITGKLLPVPTVLTNHQIK